ncbi:MAG: alpha/beta fold hydrolase [Candidatus Pacebacteria bacterium]|nr:alpha/beta fold hydrolase [Candidatus Paceibacterota bacterium]
MEKIKSIELSADSNTEIFLIHGYTGSPTDFHQLPYILNKKFNTNVRVILLPGHGTKIEDLDSVTYDDFLMHLTTEIEKDIRKGREIILGGVSMGGLFSLILASRYPVKGVFNVSSPYLLKFPFNILGLVKLHKYKKYWKKASISHIEKEMRKGAFSYKYMHMNGLNIVRQLRNELKKSMQKIKCPILTIYSTNDRIGRPESLRVIQNNVGSTVKYEKMFSIKPHNVFFSDGNSEVNDQILRFVEDRDIFHNLAKQPKKVAAIIPSYNEADRIGAVLEAVTAAPSIDEIIVVDDGSTDDTEKVIKKFKGVRYMRNKTNLGKASSMDIGVLSTNADIFFFCDADLINLTPEIIQQIISPVTGGLFSMFIGLRGNLMQKAVHLIAVNSGERALTRELWEKLPDYFKYRYRVEAGLNYCSRKYFNGFGFKTFNYSQPIKEKKYGFVRGTVLRWGMNVDMLYAYLRENIDCFLDKGGCKSGD